MFSAREASLSVLEPVDASEEKSGFINLDISDNLLLRGKKTHDAYHVLTE